jgi:hypothetical protein
MSQWEWILEQELVLSLSVSSVFSVVVAAFAVMGPGGAPLLVASIYRAAPTCSSTNRPAAQP